MLSRSPAIMLRGAFWLLPSCRQKTAAGCREDCSPQTTTRAHEISALYNARKRHRAVQSGHVASTLARNRDACITQVLTQRVLGAVDSACIHGGKRRARRAMARPQLAYPPTNTCLTFSPPSRDRCCAEPQICENAGLFSWSTVGIATYRLRPPLRCTYETFIIPPPARQVSNTCGVRVAMSFSKISMSAPSGRRAVW